MPLSFCDVLDTINHLILSDIQRIIFNGKMAFRLFLEILDKK